MSNLITLELARPFGEIKTTSSADLEHVRALIGKLRENNPQNNMKIKSEASTCQDDSIKLQDPTVSSSNVGASSHDNWCFVDSVTAIRFFRIDRAQVIFQLKDFFCYQFFYVIIIKCCINFIYCPFLIFRKTYITC